MKAMICTRYGPPDVLKLEEVNKPVPEDNQVLIRIYTTSVTAADYRIRGLNVPTGFGILMRLFLGFNKPRKAILGMNLAGRIEETGKNVSQYKKGDAVFGTSGMAFGTYAEYICLTEDSALVIKPDTISYEEAAAFPFGALTALAYLRDMANIQSAQKVLIYGASGSVGTASVQLAKYLGAEVTGVCSTGNLQMVQQLGADSVIDYTREDFTQSENKYDIIFDTVGKTSFTRCLQSLTKNGKYLLAVAGLPQYIQILWTNITANHKVYAGTTSDDREGFIFLAKLLISGKMKPMIDRCYPFEQLPEAHAYAEKGHKKGNVVIVLKHSDTASD